MKQFLILIFCPLIFYAQKPIIKIKPKFEYTGSICEIKIRIDIKNTTSDTLYYSSNPWKLDIMPNEDSSIITINSKKIEKSQADTMRIILNCLDFWYSFYAGPPVPNFYLEIPPNSKKTILISKKFETYNKDKMVIFGVFVFTKEAIYYLDMADNCSLALMFFTIGDYPLIFYENIYAYKISKNNVERIKKIDKEDIMYWY